MIEKLKRKQLRYLMFRFKNEALGDGKKIRGPEAKTLLEGWGQKLSKSKANGVLGDIKDIYESQESFGGWENFSEIQGKVNSWDIGMYDNNTDERHNLILMFLRPHKWFLYGIDKYQTVLTREYEQKAQAGLDYFDEWGLVFSEKKMLEMRMKNPGSRESRRRDPIYFENDPRDFDYLGIIKHANKEKIIKWPSLQIQTSSIKTLN